MALNDRGQVVPDAPITGWRILSQQERPIPGPQGTLNDMIRVTFELGDGTQGTVDVAKNAYSAANVRAAVAEYAARLSEVGKLTG